MAREYSLELGGASRPLAYTSQDRRDLEKRFGKGLREIIFEDVLPMDADHKPTGGGLLEQQIAFLHVGLKHNDAKVMTEKKVSAFVDEYVQKGNHIIGLLGVAVSAVLASGVLGFVYEIQDESEGKADPGTEG